MKRPFIIGSIVAVVACVGVGLLALSRSPQWTTSSPEALAAMEMALQARMKLYEQDAAGHLARALELDPEFVAAKLHVVDLYRFFPNIDRDQLWKEIEAADLESLTARERVLVLRARAMKVGDYEEAVRLVDEYLSGHPDDPFVLNIKATVAWSNGDLEVAERVYKHLIKISPNWVLGYNHLGYITMSQGRFPEAEEYFTSYRFIAPDQANPHDSLGELYIVLGRYDEAVKSLEEAILIRPSFLASYEHLILAHLMREDLDAAAEVLERLTRVKDRPDRMVGLLGCAIDYAGLELRHEWAEILEREGGECYEAAPLDSYVIQLTHRAAATTGRRDVTLAIEERVAGMIQEIAEKGKSKSRDAPALVAVLDHLKGTRLALEGRLEEAAERLQEADSNLTYMGAGLGVFKLGNRLLLVEVLRGLGREIEAHRILDQQVRVINPEMARDFEEKGLKLLGLDD